MEETRQDYVRWAQRRAVEELELNGPEQAINSLVSDLAKRPDTRLSPFLTMLALRYCSSKVDARKFIEGCR